MITPIPIQQILISHKMLKDNSKLEEGIEQGNERRKIKMKDAELRSTIMSVANPYLSLAN